MSSVYAWCSTLCAVLVIASIVRIIAPGEKTMRILSMVIGVFVILAVVSPLVNFARNLDLSSSAEELFSLENDLSDNYNEEVMRETGDYLAAYVSELLKASKANPRDVQVVMGVKEDGGIYISRCRIYMDKDDYLKEKEVKELIGSNLFVEPAVIYE